MGFRGKQVIHPDQVPLVQAAFSPSPQRVEWAEGLIEAFNQHQSSGKVRSECVRVEWAESGRRGQSAC